MADEAEPAPELSKRRVRADAQRNLLNVLQAAKEVFAQQGVDAPVRDITERAGVGVGTVYRHFPERADLVAAVFSREIEACADAADRLGAERPPFEALKLWMQEFVALTTTKRGLAKALHSGSDAYNSVRAKREQRLFPAFRRLVEKAGAAGEIRSDVEADDVLNAATVLCMSGGYVRDEGVLDVVMLMVDGLKLDSTDR